MSNVNETRFDSLKAKAYKVAAVATPAMLAVPVYANTAPAAPDMSPIVQIITGLVATVASVGMAVLSVYATGKVFKWVKTAF